MQGQQKKYLDSKYVAFVNASSLFFTAPHSKKLKRSAYEIHKKETFTSLLACDLAIQTGGNSFIFWGPTQAINQKDLDPNYLKKVNFPQSPFHQSLHAWALQSEGRPLFHIDIHGKADRTYNCVIQVGIMSMEVHWPKDPLIQSIRKFFQNYENIFSGLKFGQFQCQINTDPSLHGYWGSDVHTMTQQAILLGIPSMQIQIPFLVRKKLAFDKELRKKFGNMIKSLYQTVIIPDYVNKKRVHNVSNEIGDIFKSSLTKDEVEVLADQLFQHQTTGQIPVQTIY